MEVTQQKVFRKDFNNNELTNDEMLKKYPFSNIKELINYAKNNNLVDKQKPFTKEEKENLNSISKLMKNPFK